MRHGSSNCLWSGACACGPALLTLNVHINNCLLWDYKRNKNHWIASVILKHVYSSLIKLVYSTKGPLSSSFDLDKPLELQSFSLWFPERDDDTRISYNTLYPKSLIWIYSLLEHLQKDDSCRVYFDLHWDTRGNFLCEPVTICIVFPENPCIY